MKTELCIDQGASLSVTWAWYSGSDVAKAISALVAGFPTAFTATSHGLPTGVIPVALLDVNERSTVDQDGDPTIAQQFRVPALKTGTNTFTIQQDSTSDTTFVGPGTLVYTPPRDLTAFTASAKFFTGTNIASPVLALADSGGGITLGGTEGTVNLLISATQSAALTASLNWVLDLTDTTPTPNVVYRFRKGTLKVILPGS